MQNRQKNDPKIPLTKKCSSCGETKAGTEFSKDRTKKDGLYHLCKVCRSAYRLRNKKSKEANNKGQKTSNPEDNPNKDVGVLAIVHSGVECGVCSNCGASLMGYIPGYLRGLPVCKDCVIINLKTMFCSNKKANNT